MKKFMKRSLAIFLTAILLLPIIGDQNAAVVNAAASPTFVKSKVTISGIGETYQLKIKNKVAKSKYKWSSSDNKIATVTSSGLVTSVGKGTVNIKCRITYPTKKTKTLSCKVTVLIPATDISITNTLDNGAYQMTTGETADLDTILTPSDSTDKTYWFIDDEYADSGCVRIDDAAEGKITALKAGIVVLTVRAAKTATKADADKSIVDDGIIINVKDPSASVKSAEITSSNQITVVFDSAIQSSTIIGTNNVLLDNILLTPLKNTKNVLANDPGTLTANLSADLKTLTITSANKLEGDYRISFTSDIKTTGGVALDNDSIKLTYNDVIAPYVTGGVTLDDSGMKATINFSEEVDFSSFSIKGAQTASSSQTATANTLSIIGNTNNYIISADKKSLTIDLSNISATDYGKSFVITMSGIKDLSGNLPTSAYLTAIIYTDVTLKPQAQLLTLTRTSYYTLTATFDRAIRTGGNISINNGSSISGVVDTTDAKKVNYTMSPAEARYTGTIPVSIFNWNSYNVNSTDTTGKTPITRYVNFDADKTVPVLTNYVYDAATGILTMTYSEDVNISSTTGIFTARIETATGEITQGNNISYTNVTHSDGKNIIKLKLTNMTKIGTYTFTVGQGFVTDNFMNPSAGMAVSISNKTAATMLPDPVMVTQSDTDPSKITLTFLNMLDAVSAQNVSNYSITGVTLLSAALQTNTSTGATVELIAAPGSIDVTVERYLKINGVMGYNGSYTAITGYSKLITLKDNKAPYYIDPPIFDSNAKNVVRLNFSEAIQGSLTVKVYQVINSTSIEITNTVSLSGNIAYINLDSTPTNGTWLKIQITGNSLTDTSGNKLTFTTDTLGVAVAY